VSPTHDGAEVLSDVVRSAAARAGIDKLAPYDLRGTCARLHYFPGSNPMPTTRPETESERHGRLCKHPTPVLRTKARLSCYHAPRRRRRKLGDLQAVHLLAEDGSTRGIHADQMEPILPDINADNRWLRHVPLLFNARRHSPRGGADHSITP